MNEGYLALYIAIIKGVPTQTAFRLLDDPTHKTRLSPKDVTELAELREHGYTLNDLSEIYGASIGAISKAISRYKRRTQ